MNENEYEVIVVGGSYAGLSAAMTLGRSLRKTLIIDSGKPCNRQTPHSHNFMTQDGRKPSDIAQDALKQVLHYGTVQKADDLVIDVRGQDQNFLVRTKSGAIHEAKKLLFATGIKDLMPDIPGFAESWGITVIHCPYCHGYEVRGKNTGILVNDESADQFARLIKNWTPHLKIFANGEAQFDKTMIKELGLDVIEKPIAQIVHQDGYISSLQFADDSSEKLDALYYRPAFVQHCDIPEKFGCELTDTGHLKVTEFQQTTVSGIYAVGDCTTPFRSVANAVAQGNIGAAMLNHELINES
ncbi:MAG: NAD(P)/FAD-dependent oxidoreductase [Cyclobacteriaceae bacterium]|nr:NAD(P)/FAD-dependent oxidoreductase [Cyclobacteriaceae bacterium SS2]MBV6647611.1 NAD(P)/FAD-dependent oxidoreductase [Cyclobacteriaceae bacterium HetDA_MAG_MS6]